MLASIRSSAVVGVESLEIDVEVDVATGLPSFEIVGLPGTAVREARDRVRTAIRNSGYRMPPGRVTVNLAPAHIPKTGTLFDLPIALGILVASGAIESKGRLDRLLVAGELSLDGTLRPIRGALCIAAAHTHSDRSLVLPRSNLAEVNVVPGVQVYAIESLHQLTETVGGSMEAVLTKGNQLTPGNDGERSNEWSQIKGQESVKRALQISAAGGHHLFLMGPPGAGKTALAKALVALAPPLSGDEVVEVSKVYSVGGFLSDTLPFVQDRPFRHPHHTVTTAGLLGGGSTPRPGEISLAHRGFLFLDEFAEFQPHVLEALREPLEEGRIILSRAGGMVPYPATFTLVAAANPCPCGFLGDPVHPCSCTEGARQRYSRRMSGPLLDRIDMFVSVRRPRVETLFSLSESEESIHVARERVVRARHRQNIRFGGHSRTNSSLSPSELLRWVKLDESGRTLLTQAGAKWSLSPRAIHRVMRVARTIADLDDRAKVEAADVAEALSYRFWTHK